MSKGFSIFILTLLFVGCSPKKEKIPVGGDTGGLIDVLAPVIHFSVPASPNPDTQPVLHGKAKADADVDFFSDTLCEDSIGTGKADSNGNFTVQIQVLANSTTSIYAQATADGRTSKCTKTSLTYNSDNDAPEIKILTPPVNKRAQTGLTITGTCEDGLPIILSGGLTSPLLEDCESGAFSIDIIFTAGSGNKDITVKQTDLSGNTSSDTRRFVRDTTAPNVTVVSPANNAQVQSPIVATGACETGLDVEISGTGHVSPATAPCYGSAYTVSIVPTPGDGVKAITLKQTDEAGNIRTVSRTWTVDTVPPNLTVVTPADQATVGSSDIQVDGTCENGIPINLSGAGLDNPNVLVCSAGVFSDTVHLVAGQGSREIKFEQTDQAGNVTLVTRSLTVDSFPPGTPEIQQASPVSPSGAAKPTFSGTGEADTIISFYSDSSCNNLLKSTTPNGSGQFIEAVPVDVGMNTLHVLAENAAGIKSPCSPVSFNYERYAIPVGVGHFFNGAQTIAPADATNINQNTAYSVKYPDSFFDDEYYAHNKAASSHMVTIKKAGNYKISYNIPANGAIAHGAPMAEVYVNGRVVPGTLTASSYRSASDSQNHSSLGLVGFLNNLNINDKVEVKVKKSAASGSITTIESSLYMEYLAGARTVFVAHATETNAPIDPANLNPSLGYELKWQEVYKTAGFTHSNFANSENITLGGNGTYLVSVNIPVSGTDADTSTRMILEINGAPVSYAEAKQGVVQNIGGHNLSSLHFNGFVPNVGAGDILTVKLEQGAALGNLAVPLGKQASLVIEKINPGDKVFATTGDTLKNGGNWAPIADDFIEWTADYQIDGATYSHSTAVNPHEVQVQSDGSYVLYFNVGVSGDLANINAVMKVSVNGLAIDGAQVKTFYISNSGGHVESSGAMGYFLYDLRAGDKISLSTSRRGANGTFLPSPGASLFLQKKE